jgi:hypothetical protein
MRETRLARTAAGLVGVAFAASLSACGGSDAPTWSISGAVSGAVSQGVTVTLGGASSAMTTTDISGHYAFAGLADGTYTVTPSLAGFAYNPLSRSVPVSGADVGGQDFTASAVVPHTISGTVSGAVSQGVTVYLWGATSARTTTDASGYYAFTGLADGSYGFRPSLAGYAFTPYDRTVSLSGADVGGQDFTASLGYDISGTVSGGWSQGVVVTLGGARSATTRTDVSGHYAFTDIPEGSYTVTPSHTGYVFTPDSRTVSLSGADVGGQDFTASAVVPHTISGTVSGAVSQGVAVVVLRSDGSRATTTTDPSGHYAFTGYADGNYTVMPYLAGYTFTPASRQVSVSGADVAGQDFAAQALPPHVISGTLIPVGPTVHANGVPVTLSGASSATTKTDGLGHYYFAGLANGSYTVTPKLISVVFGPTSRSVTVSGANVGGQDFLMCMRIDISQRCPSTTWSISGTVSGAVSQGVGVVVLRSDGSRATTTTDASGYYAFSGLANGSYAVTPSLTGYTFDPPNRLVTVSGANVGLQNFSAAAVPHAISGTVSGAVSQGVTVTLGGASSATTTTNASGYYAFASLADGSYTVTPALAGYTFAPASLSVTVSGADVGGQDFRATAVPRSEQHWCPINGELNGVWENARDDAWAVGNYGVIMHWDGASWAFAPSGTTAGLRAVWGRAANDVWAVGDGTTLHWDGVSWALVPPGTAAGLLGVWGSAKNDVWAVGRAGTILHWNGTAWSPVESGTTYTLNAVWGSRATDVWAVGGWAAESFIGRHTTGQVILHWNGTAWSPVPRGSDALLAGVWGSGPDDVWAVGSDFSPGGAGFLHWDGWFWTPAGPSGSWRTVWGTSSSDVSALSWDWGAIAHWDGTAWTTVWESEPWPPWHARGISGNGGWVVGEAGMILGRHSATWAIARPGVQGGPFAGVADDDVWGVDYVQENFVHWVDFNPIRMMPTGTAAEFFGGWASEPDDVWAVGTSGTIMHWDGTKWSDVTSSTAANLMNAWGSSGNDVWAVGDSGTIVHWDGAKWRSVPSGTTVDLVAVWGDASDDVWVVGGPGYPGTVLHWDGAAWTTVVSGTQSLRDIWGSGAADVWAVGFSSGGLLGVILHRDGGAWKVLPFPVSSLSFPYSVGGTSATDVWIAGYPSIGLSSSVLHWDGSTWSEPDYLQNLSFGFSNLGKAGLWAGSGWDGSAWRMCR